MKNPGPFAYPPHDHFANPSGTLQSVTAPPREVLYHFTNSDGFLGIVDSKRLRASDLRFLNDSRELLYGLEIILEALSPALKVLSPAAAVLFDETPRNLFSGGRYSVFVLGVSFSEEHDRLSQWRAYGGTRGIALGFPPGVMRRIQQTNRAFLGKVEYERDKQASIAKAFAEEVVRRLSTVGNWSNPLLSPDQYAEVMYAMDSAALVASFMKDSSFEEEKEWRLVTPLPLADTLSFRTSRGVMVPYADLQLDDRDFRDAKVVIGPGPHPELLEEAVSILLNRLAPAGRRPGALGGIPGISHSSIPYRNW